MKRLFSMSRLLFAALLAGLVTVTLGGMASAESPAEFYKGKTVTMWIGFDGGGFRSSARLLGKLCVFPSKTSIHQPGNTMNRCMRK